MSTRAQEDKWRTRTSQEEVKRKTGQGHSKKVEDKRGDKKKTRGGKREKRGRAGSRGQAAHQKKDKKRTTGGQEEDNGRTTPGHDEARDCRQLVFPKRDPDSKRRFVFKLRARRLGLMPDHSETPTGNYERSEQAKRA